LIIQLWFFCMCWQGSRKEPDASSAAPAAYSAESHRCCCISPLLLLLLLLLLLQAKQPRRTKSVQPGAKQQRQAMPRRQSAGSRAVTQQATLGLAKLRVALVLPVVLLALLGLALLTMSA
jgi:hypothetical protein